MFRSERREFQSREIRENEKRIVLTLFIEISVSRWIERCRELSRFKMARRSYQAAIERCPQQCDLDGLRSYRESIEHTGTSSMDRESIDKLSSLILRNLDGSKLR